MRRNYAIFIILIAISGLVLAIIATSPFGAGVSSDAVRTLSTADNLLSGKGFFDYSGAPLLWWPPLYPMILAFFAKITGLDLFIVAWYFNLFLHALNIWLAGVWLFPIFKERIVWAYLGVIVVATSLSILKISISIGPDSLFITLSLLFFIIFRTWDGQPTRTITLLEILVAIATLHRFLSIVMAATGSVYILIRGKSKHKLKTAISFSIFSCLPLVAWLIIHNYLQFHTIFGPRDYVSMLPGKNIFSFLEKILNWFLPYFSIKEIWDSRSFLFILSVLFIAFVATNNKIFLGSLIRKYLKPEVLPSIIFLLLYLTVLIFTVDYFEHKYQSDDRFLAIILIPIICIVFLALDHFLSRIKLNSNLFNLLVIAFFGIWSLYPITTLYENISLSYQTSGVVHNNIYNTPIYRNSDTIHKVNILLEQNQEPISLYSNKPLAVWFFTRNNVKLLPLKNTENREAEISQLLSASNSSTTYIVWLIPDIYEITITPQKLSKTLKLETVFTSANGEIYIVDIE